MAEKMAQPPHLDGKPKLVYFDLKAKGEAIRLAFAVGGIDFTDCRLSREEFEDQRGSFPFGQVPVLFLGDVVLAQSVAILHYVGRLAGLVPTDPFKEACVLQVLATMEDIVAKFSPSIREHDEQKKCEMRKQLVKEILPFWLQRLDRIIAQQGREGYCVGNELTIADLQVYAILDWLCLSGTVDGVPMEVCNSFGNIMKVIKTVGENEKVMKWNARRTVT